MKMKIKVVLTPTLYFCMYPASCSTVSRFLACLWCIDRAGDHRSDGLEVYPQGLLDEVRRSRFSITTESGSLKYTTLDQYGPLVAHRSIPPRGKRGRRRGGSTPGGWFGVGWVGREEPVQSNPT